MTILRQKYEKRYDGALVSAQSRLQDLLNDYFKDVKRIDRISVRSKSVDRFLKKAEKLGLNGHMKYADPLNDIQDQLGARIISFYLNDVETISKQIEKYFRPIEERKIVPDSAWEFGYFGRHFILMIPNEVKYSVADADDLPECFELQVKTLFQHAWSEAEHDLAYKPELGELNVGESRKLAFTAAQAWGADQIFDELFLLKTSQRA